MKGPGHRHRFDVRRSWVCPACNRRVKTSGRVVHLLCDCLMKSTPPRQTSMSLLEERPRTKPSAPVGTATEEGQPSTPAAQIATVKEPPILPVQIANLEVPATSGEDAPLPMPIGTEEETPVTTPPAPVPDSGESAPAPA